MHNCYNYCLSHFNILESKPEERIEEQQPSGSYNDNHQVNN
jgi:hypothetical protein